ncbi:MAG: polysaccharide deacetylase family protein [Peptococcaceae bacterium]|nr:polysaccharide deacetylase family protein [Peptococcaceae bacterium]
MRKLFPALILISVIAFLILAAADAGDKLSESLVSVPEKFDGVPILMYHKINPDPGTGGYGLRVSPRDFEKQVAYLARSGYTSVSLTDLADHHEKGKPLPPRPVVITFDDGYLDNYVYAYPILRKYGMTATVFVVAGTVGGINGFDYSEGRQPLNRMAGWRELEEMAEGGITIGAHTLTHPSLTGLEPEAARHEITEGKKRLEAALKRPVEVFCYPYGNYDQAIVQIVRESGFRAAVTADQGLGRYREDPYALKRIRVRGDYSYGRFLQELTRYHSE